MDFGGRTYTLDFLIPNIKYQIACKLEGLLVLNPVTLMSCCRAVSELFFGVNKFYIRNISLGDDFLVLFFRQSTVYSHLSIVRSKTHESVHTILNSITYARCKANTS